VVGDDVFVVAQKQPDGSFLAIVIVKAGFSAGPVRTEVEFDGVVESISPGFPTGVWTIGGTKVVVPRGAEVKGSPAVGDTVHVEGVKNPDGVVQARLIEKL
jgi:hypothetical protein